MKAPEGHLDHHHDQPDQPGRNVQPMAADQGEEGGQEGAALRAGAAADHVGELAELEREERQAECEGDQSAEIGAEATSRLHRQRHQSAGVTRGKEAGRFDGDACLAEQLHAARPAVSRARQHGIGRKQRREHHDVAQQEDPEAEGDDDWLRRRAGFACLNLRPHIGKSNGDVHGVTSAR